MARYENSISTLQARTLVSVIHSYKGIIDNRFSVEKVGKLAVKICLAKFPEHFPKTGENIKSFVAFSLSATAKEGVKRGELKVIDYIALLASVKEENEQAINDFGAFGDLYEVLIRCAFIRKLSLVRWSALSVKSIEKSDMASKKFGIVEIGHNGKTLTYGTLIDYMDGEYTSVVYGVFSEEDKKAVYDLCKAKEYNKAIDYVTSYSVYWSDKYAFAHDMDNLTKGKGITVKSCGVQVVYNESKYYAFTKALNDGIFKSLKETLSE